jgi:hypothetical protein
MDLNTISNTSHNLYRTYTILTTKICQSSVFQLDNDFEILDRVKQLASKKNVTPAQISLA